MSMSLLRRSSAVLALALLAASCGKGTPAEPTPDPTPTPAPAATPTPAPAPTPVNARVACGVGAGSGDGLEHSCPRSGENFLRQVNEAIDRVVVKSPQIFDFNNQRGDGGYYVKAVNQYYNGWSRSWATPACAPWWTAGARSRSRPTTSGTTSTTS
jgi:hypothetical protein